MIAKILILLLALLAIHLFAKWFDGPTNSVDSEPDRD